MRFVSDSPRAEFAEEPNVAQVIDLLQQVNSLNPNTTVVVGSPVGADRFEPKPLTALRELNINGKNQLVFLSGDAQSPCEALARLVLKAAQIHEDSFDMEAANKASMRQQKDIGFGLIDYSRFYRLSIHDACQQLEPRSLRVPVYVLLTMAWNDAIEWAKATANSQCNLNTPSKRKKK